MPPLSDQDLRALIEQAVAHSVRDTLDGRIREIVADEIRRSNADQVRQFEAVAVEQSFRNIGPILGFDPRDRMQVQVFHDRFQRSLRAADFICEIAGGASRRIAWVLLLLIAGVIGANLAAAAQFVRVWLR